MKKMIRTQAGRFFAGLIALLLAACIMVGVEQLPFLKTDITAQQLMTPDAQVKDIIGSVEKDVDICYLASDGNVDIWLEELASKYAGMNSKITYRRLAPTADGASAIAAKAGVVSAENLVIITSGDRSVAISGDEMYNIQYDEMAYYYYGEMVVKSQAYAADDRLVNGILYVTDDELPVVYALKGHGETAVTGALQAYLKDFNVRVADLSLNNAEMPGDAAVLLIHMPTSDLTDDETEKILSYLKDGGKLLLTTNYMTGDLPNLETVTAYYGMDAVAGVVLESDAKYCYSAELPYYLIPDAQQHEINAMLNETGAKGLLSLSCAMERNSIRRAGLNVTALQTTSDTSYLKPDPSTITTYEKEENDLPGPLNIAMAASEGDTRVVWYGSGNFLADAELGASGGVNAEILRGTLAWMTELKDGVSIAGKELMTEAIVVPAGNKTLIYAAMFVPAVLALLAGLIRKRKKAA